VEFKDDYLALGVAHDASADDIKNAYRWLARRFHSDVSKDADAAAQRSEDHHARILLDLEDAWRGATRALTLRAPQLDPAGHLELRERTLSVRILAGVRPGQMIRLSGQGGRSGGATGRMSQ
jgi:DnaJ-class molecular chaperone